MNPSKIEIINICRDIINHPEFDRRENWGHVKDSDYYEPDQSRESNEISHLYDVVRDVQKQLKISDSEFIVILNKIQYDISGHLWFLVENDIVENYVESRLSGIPINKEESYYRWAGESVIVVGDKKYELMDQPNSEDIAKMIEEIKKDNPVEREYQISFNVSRSCTYQDTIGIKAESKEEAERIFKEKLKEQDDIFIDGLLDDFHSYMEVELFDYSIEEENKKM